MATASGLGIPFRLPDVTGNEEDAGASGAILLPALSSSVFEAGAAGDGSATACVPHPPDLPAEAASDPDVKTTRTRTIKSRAIFTPEDDAEKRPRGKGGGRRRGHKKSDLKNLFKDDDADGLADPSFGAAGEGQRQEGMRKRSRNASDGENRWDRIRAKVKVLLQKMRRENHFIQVYQQDGWKSSGREKLKPTVELTKAQDRVRAIQAELREITKLLTEMNSDGPRWGSIKEDHDGNIKVDEVVCTKCSRGDSDDNDDILLCDYAGCFRAYHQNCLIPAIKPEAFPSEAEDWFCWQCECLTDCLEMIEEECPGTKYGSWEDVFPDAHSLPRATGSALREQKRILDDESEDSDDESFKGSSSESEEDGASDSPSANAREPAPGSEDLGVVPRGEDEDMVWMSDAESVGSDEVAKLYKEAGDFAGFGSEDGGDDRTGTLAGEPSRASRARARGKRRNVALGLPDDEATERAIRAAINGNGKIDEANIVQGRRGRKAVDYVKLNEVVFGDDEIFGEARPQDPNKKEDAYGSESYEGSDSSEESDSFKSVSAVKRAPRRRGVPTIDPYTGLPRKRGRPRKWPPVTTAAPADAPKKKVGRPRKVRIVPETDPISPVITSTAVVDGSRLAESAIGSAAGPAPVKRKRGRPRKSETAAAAKVASAAPVAHPASAAEGKGVGRQAGRPERLEDTPGAPNAIVAGVPGAVPVKRGRGRPRKHPLPVESASATAGRDGAANSQTPRVVGKRKPGRPRKHAPATDTRTEGGAKDAVGISPVRRKVGRPRKYPLVVNPVSSETNDATVINGDGSALPGPKRTVSNAILDVASGEDDVTEPGVPRKKHCAFAQSDPSTREPSATGAESGRSSLLRVDPPCSNGSAASVARGNVSAGDSNCGTSSTDASARGTQGGKCASFSSTLLSLLSRGGGAPRAPAASSDGERGDNHATGGLGRVGGAVAAGATAAATSGISAGASAQPRESPPKSDGACTGSSSNGRAVSYVFTPTGRKAVLKRERDPTTGKNGVLSPTTEQKSRL